MRELLFRAQAINRIEGREYRTNYKNGDWVSGLVTRLYDERFEMLPATMTNTDGVSDIDVDHKTIGQYTGLTDKYGTKVFEGDIVKIIDTYNNCVVWYVDYKPTAFCINQKGVNYSDYLGKCNNGKYDIEVIGNIHDNSYLLKEE